MTETRHERPTPTPGDAPTRYAIRVRGHLADRWADAFAGLTLTRHADGTTVLSGPVADQAALHGLLRRVRDLGLPLLSVVPTGVAEDPAPLHPGEKERPR